MARFVYALNQSLDGCIDHMAFGPGPALFRHFIQDVQGLTGCLYGRVMYEVMRYWDDDHAEWDEDRWAYAKAWRKMHKWVVSSTLDSVGPNATLIGSDVQDAVRAIKQEHEGVIEVAGPTLAHGLTEFGLIDAYHMYMHPVVVGHGKTYFAGPSPRLRLEAHEMIDEEVIRLVYVPA